MQARFEEKLARPVLAILVLAGLTAFADAQSITPFPVRTPTATIQPFAITSGPDGNLWFTEALGGKIGKITPSGAVTEYSASNSYSITAGPDGAGGMALWFIGGRISTSGVVTPFPTVAGNDITAGPDGNLWLARGNGVGRFSPSDPPNTLVDYPTVEHVTTTYSVTTGSDGNIWFIELDHYNSSPDHTGRIAKIDLTKLNGCSANPSLCITEYPVPGGENAVGTSLASGPDGALWSVGGKVNRITTGGVITQFSSEGAVGQSHITGGPDGALWYTAIGKLVRVATSGAATDIPVSAQFTHPRGITAGPDGNVWFTDLDANKIDRVNLGGGGGNPTPTPTPPVTSGSLRARVTPLNIPTPRSVSGRQ